MSFLSRAAGPFGCIPMPLLIAESYGATNLGERTPWHVLFNWTSSRDFVRSITEPGEAAQLRSAARIRTWTIGTKIRGAAFTLRRTSGRQTRAHMVTWVRCPRQPSPQEFSQNAVVRIPDTHDTPTGS
jgi:hypothetical protein